MIDNAPFLFLPTSPPMQRLLSETPRSESNRTRVALPRMAETLVSILFNDTASAHAVTPRFVTIGGDEFLEGTPAEAPGVTQHYLLGDSNSFEARVTGSSDSPGHIRDADYDLRVEFRSKGLTGSSSFAPPVFVLEMLHESSEPVTYHAFVTLGS